MRPRFFLLLAPLLLAACGGSAASKSEEAKGATAEKPAASSIDACDLFPDDEANAIAGSYVSGMSSTFEDAKGRDPLSCAYNAGSTEQPRILSLLVRLHETPERAEKTLRATRGALDTLTHGDLKDVPDLGDGAFWAGGSLMQLHVRKGEKQLLITCQLNDPAASFAGAQKIAKAALGRL
ncbi:MAG TPA: hypothetical protein VN851_18270 [Thermoanaerobaculia bacterium]|nr:hypothetical protein [Thermoanaerobaculia bacterium]